MRTTLMESHTWIKHPLLQSPISHSDQENDNGRCPNRCVIASEDKASGSSMNSETGNRIGPLITRVEKIAGRIDVETARVVAPCPCLSGESEGARLAD